MSCIGVLAGAGAAHADAAPDGEACAAAEAAFKAWSPGWKGQAVVAVPPTGRAAAESEAGMRLGWSGGAPSKAVVAAYAARPPSSMLACPNVVALARASGHAVAPPEAAARSDVRPEGGVTRLALPVVAPGGREALVEVVHTGKVHGGLQQFMLLRKTDGGWRVVSHRGGAIG